MKLTDFSIMKMNIVIIIACIITFSIFLTRTKLFGSNVYSNILDYAYYPCAAPAAFRLHVIRSSKAVRLIPRTQTSHG